MSDEPRAEYHFDYSQARRNRFAEARKPGGRVVYLDPDVAAAFTDSAQVNRLLRALLEAMPTQGSGEEPAS